MKRACFFCLICCLISSFVFSQSNVVSKSADASQGDAKAHAEKSRHVPTGSGNPLFQPAVTYASGAGGGYSLAVADVNGDGKPDLVVANGSGGNGEDGSVAVLLGNGDGTFQPAVSYDTGGEQTFSVAIADLNGDGKPDLVVTNSLSNNIGVLLGNGDGTFQPAVTYSVNRGIGHECGEQGAYPVNATVGDLNGDGIPDIVVDDEGCGKVSVLLGRGDGTFRPPSAFGGGGSWVTLADVVGNGPLDAIVADGLEVNVLLGTGTGRFIPPHHRFGHIFLGGTGTASYVTVADVNGDGIPDLVVSGNCSYGCSQGMVGVLLGKGGFTGSFQETVWYESGANNPTAVAVADVNGDGKLDLVVSNFCSPSGCSDPGAGSVGVLLGNGDGTFQPALTFGAGGYWGTFSTAVADVNGDGWPDVLVANFEGYSTGGSSAGVLLSNIGSMVPTNISISTSPNPSTYGQGITVTAAVSSESGTPTGSVIFLQGPTVLGTATLVNGSASLPVSGLPPGSLSIAAGYQGSGDFGYSTTALNQVVLPAPTTTKLSSSANPSVSDKKVVLTATVSSSAGTPTGSVTFRDSGTVLGTKRLSGAGTSSLTTIKLPTGSNGISATYGGSTDFGSSSSPPLTQVVLAATTATITSSANPSTYGEAVTLTAEVSSSEGAPPNGESVSFMSGKTVLGTGTLSGGSASFTTSALKVGTHSITAVYGGDATFAGSKSAAVRQVVEK